MCNVSQKQIEERMANKIFARLILISTGITTIGVCGLYGWFCADWGSRGGLGPGSGSCSLCFWFAQVLIGLGSLDLQKARLFLGLAFGWCRYHGNC